jgi:propanol-preferring alcohol dehydrogenase
MLYVGSTLGNRVDLAKTFGLHAAGKTRVITELRKLEQVNGKRHAKRLEVAY